MCAPARDRSPASAILEARAPLRTPSSSTPSSIPTRLGTTTSSSATSSTPFSAQQRRPSSPGAHAHPRSSTAQGAMTYGADASTPPSCADAIPDPSACVVYCLRSRHRPLRSNSWRKEKGVEPTPRFRLEAALAGLAEIGVSQGSNQKYGSRMAEHGASVRPVVAVGVIAPRRKRSHPARPSAARPPSAGKWSVPGGRVGARRVVGERPRLRELREETGLTCTLGPIVEVLDRVVRSSQGDGDGDGAIQFHYVILDFLGSASDRARSGRGQRLSGCAHYVSDRRLCASYELTDGLEEVVLRARAARDSNQPGPLRVHQI